MEYNGAPLDGATTAIFLKQE